MERGKLPSEQWSVQFHTPNKMITNDKIKDEYGTFVGFSVGYTPEPYRRPPTEREYNLGFFVRSFAK